LGGGVVVCVQFKVAAALGGAATRGVEADEITQRDWIEHRVKPLERKKGKKERKKE
jgi:hypothetical protein